MWRGQGLVLPATDRSSDRRGEGRHDRGQADASMFSYSPDSMNVLNVGSVLSAP